MGSLAAVRRPDRSTPRPRWSSAPARRRQPRRRYVAPTTTSSGAVTSVAPSTTGPLAPTGVAITGNAVCDPAAAQTQVIWTVTNSSTSAVGIIGDTRGLTFSADPIPPGAASTATEVIDSPAAVEQIAETVTVDTERVRRNRTSRPRSPSPTAPGRRNRRASRSHLPSMRASSRQASATRSSTRIAVRTPVTSTSRWCGWWTIASVCSSFRTSRRPCCQGTPSAPATSAHPSPTS